MELNIELFKKIRERIATVPQSYNQTLWYTHEPTSPCGTAACLAGEAIICAAPTLAEGIANLRVHALDHDDVPHTAGELLGLGRGYYSRPGSTIFDGDASGWPVPYRLQYQEADSDVERAAAAVAFLDYIIATGSIE